MEVSQHPRNEAVPRKRWLLVASGYSQFSTVILKWGLFYVSHLLRLLFGPEDPWVVWAGDDGGLRRLRDARLAAR